MCMKEVGTDLNSFALFTATKYRFSLTQHSDDITSLIEKLSEKVRSNHDLFTSSIDQLNEDVEDCVETTINKAMMS